jgi:hypothetical protein
VTVFELVSCDLIAFFKHEIWLFLSGQKLENVFHDMENMTSGEQFSKVSFIKLLELYWYV